MSRFIQTISCILVFTAVSMAGVIEITRDIALNLVTTTPNTIVVNIYKAATGGSVIATQTFPSGTWSADYNFYSYSPSVPGDNTARFRVSFTNTSSLFAGQNYWFDMVIDGNSMGRMPLPMGPAMRSPGTVMDMDGNVYHTIIIGNQEWTVENIRTTTLNDGTAIPLVTDGPAWGGLSTPAYCFYDNSTNLAEQQKWGALYNWFTVNTGKLAPPPQAETPAATDWHVPTDADWTVLENYLIANGYNYDGTTSGNKIAKSMATGKWSANSGTGVIGNNLSLNNRSGFSALPAGCRYDDASFNSLNAGANYWSTTESAAGSAWAPMMCWFCDYVNRGHATFKSGYSIRLVRDLN